MKRPGLGLRSLVKPPRGAHDLGGWAAGPNGAGGKPGGEAGMSLG